MLQVKAPKAGGIKIFYLFVYRDQHKHILMGIWEIVLNSLTPIVEEV